MIYSPNQNYFQSDDAVHRTVKTTNRPFVALSAYYLLFVYFEWGRQSTSSYRPRRVLVYVY